MIKEIYELNIEHILRDVPYNQWTYFIQEATKGKENLDDYDMVGTLDRLRITVNQYLEYRN